MGKLLYFCIIFFSWSSAINSSPVQYQITFPLVEQYDQCYVNQQHTLQGRCKKISECPNAIIRWQEENIRPETCYFDKLEQVVCCENVQLMEIKNSAVTIDTNVKRRSEIACSNQVFKIKARRFLFNRPSIIKGEITQYKEHPYMAALGWKANSDDGIVYHCGGVLISFNFVLTAAHCADRGGELPIAVRTGGGSLTDTTVSNVNIKRIIVHPEYKATMTYNDIALIELAQNAYDRPACIWPLEEPKYKTVTAIGYGHTLFAGVSSAQLLKATLQIVPQSECNKHYTSELSSGIIRTQICAKDPQNIRDTCQGDSGGPIIMEDDLPTEVRRYVVGITSFGLSCATNAPGVYTRVASYIDWIEDIVWPL